MEILMGNDNDRPAFAAEKNDLFKRLDEAFGIFEDLQERFLVEFKERPNEMFDNMSWWENERGKSCIIIQGLLNAFQDGLRDGIYSLNDANSWKRRLGRLIENEDHLYAALSCKKKEIMDRLKTLNKGKDALKGYKKFGFGGR